MTHPPLARAQGISGWTNPSKLRRKKARKGSSARVGRVENVSRVGGKNRFGALLGTNGNEDVGGGGKVAHKARPPRGSTPPTTDSVRAACTHMRPPPPFAAHTASLAPSCSGHGRDDHSSHQLRLCLRPVLVAQALPVLQLAPPLCHPRADLPRSRVCALLVLCHRRASLLAAVRLAVADIASRNVRKVIYAGRTR